MIYAVNRKTREHFATNLSEWSMNKWPHQKFKIIECDADGWIEWHGGNLPLPRDQPVECKIVGDKKVKGQACEMPFSSCSPVWRVVAYRPILEDKPRAPEWDGEGLPPVGTECEMHTQDGWLECEIVFNNNDYAIGHILPGQPSYFKCDWSREGFRRIRTKREEWIEAAIHAHVNAPYPASEFEAIYDALKSGDLPQP